MRRCLVVVGAVAVCSAAGGKLAAEEPPAKVVFVEKGAAKLVREEVKPWKRGQGYLEGAGYDSFLYAGRVLGDGDFRITARLRILKLARSAASFFIDDRSHFGFEGANGQLFVQGPLFAAKTRFLGKGDAFVKDGQPFTFEVVRKGAVLTFLIDGKQVCELKYKRPSFGLFGFRPWRSRMQIMDFSIEGDTRKPPPPRTQPKSYTIPVIDLSHETHRQVVVERTPGQYLGHPTTVLLRDNRTILVTYPLGHGGPAAVLKRSTDGGLTWSDRLTVPDNWKTAKNCPCLHRLTGPDGVERLFVFEGNGPMRQAMSLDNGKTWTPFAPNGLHCVVAPITIVPISGGRHLQLVHRGHSDRDRSPLTIWQSISSDGGLTWGPQRKVAEFYGADVCEPAIIRSPDGKRLAAVMRENRRRYNSFLITSNDEGETWSKPVELPAALTGDRHMPRYAPDGRLVMVFRDTAHWGPTRGQFVAWVGTYDDLVSLREGQYRVCLLRSPKTYDLGYPGLELLPDGTFVATTYAVLAKGEKNSVVSVRFTMKELDERAAWLPKQEAVFTSGKDGYHTYRIPAIVVTKKGTVLAFCEGRKRSGSDYGDIDLVLKRSFDNGKTWEPMQIVVDDGPNTAGNPAPVVDESTGTIWMPFCKNLGDKGEGLIKEGKAPRTVWVTHSTDDGATWSEPVEITKTTKRDHWRWYATGPCHGIQLKSGRLLIPCDYSDHDYDGHPFCSHVIVSDDHGKTWRIGGLVKDGMNECAAVETVDGAVYLNMRCYRGKHRRAVAWSRDGGETFSEPMLDDALVEPVCQASVVRFTDVKRHDKNRVLFSNPAATSRVQMTVRMSYDECKTWPVSKLLNAGPSAYSDLCVLGDMTICCLYECGEKHAYETITLARFGLDWLTDGKDRVEAK